MFHWQSIAQDLHRSFLARLALGILLLAAGSPAAQAQCASLWTINGSTVCLSSSGEQRWLRYVDPRPGMRDEGVVPGTLLFEGRIDGTTLTGTAYVFSARCNRAFPYPVTGAFNADARTIILRGQPVARLSRDCRVIARRDDEQRIDLVHAPAPVRAAAVVVAPPEDAGQPRRFSAFLAGLQSCQAGDLEACDTASRYEMVTAEDRRRIAEMRGAVIAAAAERSRAERETQQRLEHERRDREASQTREAQARAQLTFETDRRLCLAGDRAACSSALASPILGAAERAHLQRRVTELDAPRPAPSARQPRTPEPMATITADPPFSIAPELVVGWLAPALGLALAMAMLVLGWKRRFGFAQAAALWTAVCGIVLTSRKPTTATSEPPTAAAATTPAAAPGTPSAPLPTPEPEVKAAASAPLPPRDTPAALAAMELGLAYLEEVRAAKTPGLEDTADRKEQLNTLSLASKQLEAATRHDPDAIFERTDADGDASRFTINELKAEVLLTEGLTHQVYDVRRALPALTAATRHDPQNAFAFYILGLAHAENRNKGPAMDALKSAVTLDPSNIKFRKELDRVENLSGAAVAAYKVTRAGERIYDAGINTLNAGVFVYNIFVRIVNFFIITWRVLTFPLRLVWKIFGLFDRALGRA